MEFQEAMERARAAAYAPRAAVDWDLVEVAGREWADQMEAGPLGEYLGHHLPRWGYPVRIEGAHPWAVLEGRVLAQAELPIPTAERNDADSIRSACAAWKSMLGTLDTQDDEARWRAWLCAWVLGWKDAFSLTAWLASQVQHKLPKAKVHPFHSESVVVSGDGERKWIITSHTEKIVRSPVHAAGLSWWGAEQPLSPFADENWSLARIAEAAQQCFIRIPDRIVARFALRRWQTSLGFEV